MSHWNSRGLRGSAFEEAINLANEVYRQRGLALFQKIPTPITPVEINQESRTITLAYFEKQSTVDYIGTAQGIPVAFDAKETAQKRLPLQNIHRHQIEFMKDFAAQGGLSFLLVNFSLTDECYLLPLETLLIYWERALAGGRKSIPMEAFGEKYKIEKTANGVLHYLEAVSLYLDEKENNHI